MYSKFPLLSFFFLVVSQVFSFQVASFNKLQAFESLKPELTNYLNKNKKSEPYI